MQIGDRLNQRYTLTARLGSGAMGDVYQAADGVTGQPVAIKVLDRRLTLQPDILERFKREGEALRQLRHRHIVSFVDTFQHEGQQVIVMECVSGGSLHLLIQHGPLPVEVTCRLALELCDALTQAHHLQIVHRDLKPENVLLTVDGIPKLTDFGVARLVGEGTRLTGTGTQIGTPFYMSPEAWEGQPLDAQADIWSLGVMLYEMLTGEVPFAGDTLIAVMNKVLTAPLPDLKKLRPETPAALVKIVQRMLERDRARRYQSMREVALDLERVSLAPALAEPSPVQTAGLPAMRRLRETAAAHPKSLWVLAGAAGVCVFGSLIVAGWFFASAAPARPTATATALATAAQPTLTPVPQRPSATPTILLPTSTPTVPSPTPTLTPTATTRPTQISTPQPVWVTNFAEPILTAIANRRPNFQDDFSDQTGGWIRASWCGEWKITQGEMVMTHCAAERQMWYPDCVAEVDVRFLSGSSQTSVLHFSFRKAGGSSYDYAFHPNGGAAACFPQAKCIDIPGGILPEPSSNHILIIAKGQTFAFYVNDRPKFYVAREYIWPNGGIGLSIWQGTVAFDNFKIWDISDLPSP